MNVPPASSKRSSMTRDSSGPAPVPHRVPNMPVPSAYSETLRPLLRPNVKCRMPPSAPRRLGQAPAGHVVRGVERGHLVALGAIEDLADRGADPVQPAD